MAFFLLSILNSNYKFHVGMKIIFNHWINTVVWYEIKMMNTKVWLVNVYWLSNIMYNQHQLSIKPIVIEFCQNVIPNHKLNIKPTDRNPYQKHVIKKMIKIFFFLLLKCRFELCLSSQTEHCNHLNSPYYHTVNFSDESLNWGPRRFFWGDNLNLSLGLIQCIFHFFVQV